MTGIIEIIEEQDGWLAVGKPAGLSVHNAEDGYNLLSILEEQLECTDSRFERYFSVSQKYQTQSF